MIVLDGYSETATYKDWTVLYRPFTRHERPQLFETLNNLPEPLARRLLCDLIESRIITRNFDAPVGLLGDDEIRELTRLTFGVGRDEQELADEQDLADGVYLAVRYPWLLKTTCEQCRYFWYDPLTGRSSRQQPQEPPMRRPAAMPVLCDMAVGACPKGHYSKPKRMSAKNETALRWCQTHPPANDPIDARNRVIIQRATERAATSARANGRGESRSQRRREHGNAPAGRVAD